MSSLNKYELEKKIEDFLEMVKRKLENDDEKGFRVLYNYTWV